MPSIKSTIGNRTMVSLDDFCYLLSITSVNDELGQPIITEKPFMIFCSKNSITRTEFNAAGQAGHKPDMMLIVDSDAYDNERFLEYGKKKYSIYKTYMRFDGFTELYCEVKAND
jgi:SPP1 family predicted phage head-tail adaptor